MTCTLLFGAQFLEKRTNLSGRQQQRQAAKTGSNSGARCTAHGDCVSHVTVLFSRRFQMRPLALNLRPALLSFAMLAFGCNQSARLSDADVDRHPSFLKARHAYDAGDFQTAATWYERALATAPESSRLHLELGLLYDEKLSDPIVAIYHYRRYLKLRSDPAKDQLVKDFIERAKLSLASQLPQPSALDLSELTRLQNEKASLMQENVNLRSRLAALEMPVVAGAPPQPPPAPIVPPAAPAEPSRPQVHTVQKGDTLQSLALRYYGTRSAWEKIYLANRGVLPSRDQLKIGQQLTIP
jgi:tetratricopeptide (TPR) repeat protein